MFLRTLTVVGTFVWAVVAQVPIANSTTPTLSYNVTIAAAAPGFTCTFDNGACGFIQSRQDNFDWTVNKGKTGSSNTGPSGDHTSGTGYYVYIEASSPQRQNYRATLISPTINSNSEQCLSFWYHMYGRYIGRLRVTSQSQVRGQRSYVYVDKSGNRGNRWSEARVTIRGAAPYNLQFSGYVGANYLGDIALDDISVVPGRCVNSTEPSCAGGRGTCDQLCNRVSYSDFNCSCYAGYTLAADGYSCIDVDECLVDNGGCSHTCVNAIGSHYCSCPSYLSKTNNVTCGADPSIVKCSSTGMTVTFEKKEFFFLPDSLTLTNSSCTSNSNATHIWLKTEYDACSTKADLVGGEVIYSNTVFDSQTLADGGIQFFDSFEMPFECKISANRSIFQGIQEIPYDLVMRIEGVAGSLDSSLKLLSDKYDYSPELQSYDVKQGDAVYARLSSNISGLAFDPSCSVSSEAGSMSQVLISNGSSASSFAKVLSSYQFMFSYPAFTFKGKGNTVNLECKGLRRARLSNPAGPVVTEKILNDISNGSYIGKTRNLIIDPNTQNVSLTCDALSMKLTIDPALLQGSTVDELAPLSSRCFGFSASVVDGKYVYTVPLEKCGAQVTRTEDAVVYTNTLRYSIKSYAQIKPFTDVFLTHSCSYPASFSSVSYNVLSTSYSSGKITKSVPEYLVNRLSYNVFSKSSFAQMLEDGGAVSLSEAKKLFGDVGLLGLDPKAKVGLKDCTISPSARSYFPYYGPVLKDGCKTALGGKLFGSQLLKISGGSFASYRLGGLNLKCSLVVCDAGSMASCERNCPAVVSIGDPFGK